MAGGLITVLELNDVTGDNQCVSSDRCRTRMSTQRVVRVVVWGVFLPVPDQAVPSNLDVCEVTSNHSGLFNHLVAVVVVVMTVMQLLFSMMMPMIRSKNSVNTNNNAYIQARIAHERGTDGDTRQLERGTDGDTRHLERDTDGDTQRHNCFVLPKCSAGSGSTGKGASAGTQNHTPSFPARLCSDYRARLIFC